MNMSLQIVCFNVPYPPNYGGVIDVFYKIKALHEIGVKLHLHCFEYNEYKKSPILEDFCETINYYKRKGDFITHFSSIPFIVKSRKNQQLKEKLIENGAPILFEGVHTSAFFNDDMLSKIPKAIRMHNVESAYYKKLAQWESNVVRKAYFIAEATRLANFEESIYYSDIKLIAISNFDFNYFDINHRGETGLIFPFHPYEKVESNVGNGDYVFLHGDFSISENKQWVESLLPVILHDTKINVKVAGKKAAELNFKNTHSGGQLTIESDVSIDRMHKLLSESHINIVHSFNSEGFKLKLLYSLFAGRHCIANDHIIKGTKLDHLVHMGNSNEEVLIKINELRKIDFSSEMISERERILDHNFSNKRNAQKIVDILI